MTLSPTASALLASVRSDPANVALRGAYADFLQEDGDRLGAIMQRIIAEPNEDRWRLDYAAELERTAREVECELCKGKGYYSVRERGEYGPNHYQSDCLACKGARRVSDGRAEWAEFIRVQCEIANDFDTYERAPRLEPLRKREIELWKIVGYSFDMHGLESRLPWESDGETEEGIVVTQRGFPSVVRCTLAEWRGEACRHCEETGELGYPKFGRRNCPACFGSARQNAIGPRLAQAWPVVEVQVTDVNPHRVHAPRGKILWEYWRRELPVELMEPVYYASHATEAAARGALSDAAIAWARGQSVTPPPAPVASPSGGQSPPG